MKFNFFSLSLFLIGNSCHANTIVIADGLSGTRIEASKAKSAEVLILPGSGPTDRDGNNPQGIRSATYRKLAEDLGSLGVSSLRADKRGMFGSSAAARDPNAVLPSQLASDAHLWAREIRHRTGAKCVWLIGHSEGALVALIAAQDRTDICGLVLIAAPGRRLSEILREQLASNPDNKD